MKVESKLPTKDRILSAAIDLFSQYGYRAVTTKQIAEVALVNEVTLFRHFGTKRNLLEETINKFVFKTAIKKIFQEGIVWDLDRDLLFISKSYNEIMNQNRKIFLIIMKEFNLLEEEVKNPFIKFPKKLAELLTEYFAEMQRRGKVRKGNPEEQALSLLLVNFSGFMVKLLSKNDLIQGSFENYISYTIKLLIRGLAP